MTTVGSMCHVPSVLSKAPKYERITTMSDGTSLIRLHGARTGCQVHKYTGTVLESQPQPQPQPQPQAAATAAATATAKATASPLLAVAVAVAVAGWGIWPPVGLRSTNKVFKRLGL